MSAVPIIMMMMMENQRRMMEEEERRRKRMMEEEERRRKEREAEQRRQEEEYRKMIEHRKYSPVEYNDESWQQDRCVKAFSLQPCVQDFIQSFRNARTQIIEEQGKKYDGKIIEAGYEYEEIRNQLDADIEALRKTGVSISGEKYKLTRLCPIRTQIPKPEQITEYVGSTFAINGNQPIELNPDILSEDEYFENRYWEMGPEELEREFNKTSSKLKKYQAIGKYLGFLLKTKKYKELEEDTEILRQKHKKCELRKKEMLSFQSFTKEQLLTIKSYFGHLFRLSNVSDRIDDLSHSKYLLRYDTGLVYDLAIQRVISDSQYHDLVTQVREYIDKLYSNDEETMQEAYELVKGEYPISMDDRALYDKIINNIRNYRREEPKKLTLS